MKRLVATALVSVAVLLALPALSGWRGVGAAAPGAIGPFYKVYTGLDFDSLDSDDITRWGGLGGGGVWLRERAGELSGFGYLEVGVDLPAGAVVSAVTFYVRNCDTEPLNQASVYFGAYSPALSDFDYYVPQTQAPIDVDCANTQSLHILLDQPVTVDTSLYRYVLGYRAIDYGYNTYSASVKAALMGARVTYELPGAYLPMIQR